MNDWKIVGLLIVATPIVGLFALWSWAIFGAIIGAWRRGDRFPAYLFATAVWVIFGLGLMAYGASLP